MKHKATEPNVKHWMVGLIMLGVLLAGNVGSAATARARRGVTVSLVTDSNPGPAVRHGIAKVKAALKEKGVGTEDAASPREATGQMLIIAGLAEGEEPAARAIEEKGTAIPDKPESLLIYHDTWWGKPVWVVGGVDDRGLMYALLDIADRIAWAENPSQPLSKVRDAREEPDVPERALSVYTMQRLWVESTFYDETYWERYLDMLAANRFNTFVYILGYSPATYLAPSYPNFFNVEGFPDVRYKDMTPEQQKRNLEMLNRIIAMTHERGLDFTLGIWDHIPRNPELYDLPMNLDLSNVVPYTKEAIKTLLRLVPEIDAIQFRMHWESGLPRDEQVLLDFWGSVFQSIKDTGRDIRIDARAKGLPDTVIEATLDAGMNLRITTKFWAEQLGMPFHPTHINRQNQRDRRHGYADLLRYPARYKMHWKVWNAGTQKFLLWGDPEYVRRFAASTHIYKGDGFEINEIGSTKMALHPREVPFELLNKPYQYYDWEFERYWHFFQVFGRIAYNPDTPSDVWERAFEQRFGKEAAPQVMAGLHRASGILPRIIAYNMTNFPTLSGFPEKDHGGNLEKYAKTRPSDIQMFLSIKDAAQLYLNGAVSAKIWPHQTSRWFEQAASDVLASVAQAERTIGKDRNREFDSTMVDLRILSHLAQYHARRIPAGLNWAIFNETKDSIALGEAIVHEKRAIDAYAGIVEAAGDVYSDHLWYSRNKVPHWREEWAALKNHLKKLESQYNTLKMRETGKKQKTPGVVFDQREDNNPPPVLSHTPIESAKPLQPITITARVEDTDGVQWVRLLYRHLTQFEDYIELDMQPTDNHNEYQATVPGDFIVPEWDFMYLFETMDKKGKGKTYPDMEKGMPYVVVELER